MGVFLDSRPARELVRSVSANKRVLNLFSYTGGFGAAASVGGAACSHNVDSKVSFILISVPWEIRLKSCFVHRLRV